MVRLSMVILCFSLMSCLGHRTEYGRKRTFNFERPRGEVNKIVYTLVDTTKLYENLPPPEGYDYPVINKVYIKFYANGRFGEFFNCDMNDINSFLPEKANMGYYKYDKKGLQIKIFFEHPQGGGWLKERMISNSNDTLIFKVDRVFTKYKALNLPKEFLIFTPDW
jgi:hypothetical protein